MLINILIMLFVILIFYQILFQNRLFNHYPIVESMDTPDQGNAFILAQENAANIKVIKDQVDKILGLNDQVKKLDTDLGKLTDQVNGLTLN
jgi:hypothetical protein